MRGKRGVLAVLAILVTLALPVPALADTIGSYSGDMEAQSWIVTDSVGNVLAGSNIDEAMEPASITKVMTAMVVLDSDLSLDDVLTVPEMPADWENPQLAGYEAGSTATVRDLLEVMLVYSANDAAQTLAVGVAGSVDAFADLMNQKAAQIGMTETTFKNPSGMSEDGHTSTAKDLTTMGRYALDHYPLIAQLVRTSSVTVPVNGVDQTFQSTDALMPIYSPLIGIKTGLVDGGSTFLGAARSGRVTLYTCVLGCPTSWGRFQDTMEVMEWAFAHYAQPTFAKKGQVLSWRPFAFRFGYVVPVIWDQAVTGPVWPEGGATTYTRIVPSEGQLLVPGEQCGVSLWQQDGRTVAAGSLSVARAIVRA